MSPTSVPPVAVPISREALDALKAQHIAFLKARLVSDAARREWRANLEATYAALLTRTLGDVASPGALIRTLDAALAREMRGAAVAPVTREIQAAITSRLRADESALGVYVPESAREGIATLLERPRLVPDSLVRHVLEQDAMEEVMRDVLFDALKQFNDSVNPFFAEWGLPGLIKRFLPIGSGAVLKSMDAVRGEFDKRLEPEIRKFLQGFSRKALKRVADFVIASSGEPKAVALRKGVATWLYEQEVKTLAADLDDAALALIHAIGHDVAAHVVGLPSSKVRRDEAIGRFFAAHEKQTLGEIVTNHGVTLKLDFDLIADATWPLVEAVLESEPVRGWLASLTAEFYDGVEAS